VLHQKLQAGVTDARNTLMPHPLTRGCAATNHREIAEKLNVSPQTVNYRIGQALKILRKELKDYLPLFLLYGMAFWAILEK
jgi:hypothetical protein